jgi:hypothetical protein
MRAALLFGVPRWVIARSLPPFDFESMALNRMKAQAFAR